MSLDRVPAGKEIPHDCNVIIEIPMRADPIKYEVDKDTGAVFVDRFMSTAMHYPCNYGYIPHTLSDDGDPTDVLVVSPFALMPGVVVRCRPVGMLKMTDEAGGDTKLLAVPIDKLTPLYRDIETPRDLPRMLLELRAQEVEDRIVTWRARAPVGPVALCMGHGPLSRSGTGAGRIVHAPITSHNRLSLTEKLTPAQRPSQSTTRQRTLHDGSQAR